MAIKKKHQLFLHLYLVRLDLYQTSGKSISKARTIMYENHASSVADVSLFFITLTEIIARLAKQVIGKDNKNCI